jgi:hypothetical protein
MKAELLLKLNKDNNLTYEKDKEILESTISSCATLNPKTSQYDILNDIMLNEVKVDEWPYYNDAQRLIVKKNISKVKQLLNNNNTNNNNWANTSLKLNHSTLTNNNTNNQKQTTQASAFVSVEQKMQVSPSSSNQQQQQRQTLPDPILQKKFKPTSSCTVTQNPKQSEFFSLSPNSDDLLSDTEPPSSTTIQPKREKENFFQLQKSTTTTTNEFTKQYKPIDTKQQYEAYLSDFEQSYDEYLELHKFIEPITKLFEKLKSDLEQCQDANSAEYLQRKSELFKEFNQKNNLDYVKKKEKYNQLHAKLQLINKLIDQYQINMNNKLNAPS